VVKDKYKRYFAYGGDALSTISTGQKYQYTSQPCDDDGSFDLYYYGARYYDPVLGRFTSRDPMEGKYPSWNPYSYGADDPMRNRDINGLWIKEENANAFIKAVATYVSTPYKQCDCSKLVFNALSDIAAQGIGTQLLSNKSSLCKYGRVSTNMLNAAKAGSYNLSATDFILSNAKVGDLLIAPGHVEIIVEVTPEGVYTIGSGDSGVKKRPFLIDPEDPKSYKKVFTSKPELVKITEDEEGNGKGDKEQAEEESSKDHFEGWGPEYSYPNYKW
jgi:RHS repeat-associated protein